MSGPNSDQPITLAPHEVERLLLTYRAHLRSVDGTCSCLVEGCDEGAVARRHLWMAGINPEWHRAVR